MPSQYRTSARFSLSQALILSLGLLGAPAILASEPEQNAPNYHEAKLTLTPSQTQSSGQTPETDQAMESNPALTQVGTWQISLALGIGKRTSVAYQQDDLPLYLIPGIKYYGERAFFDNGTLGYTLFEEPKWALSLVTEFNPLAAQFYDYHPENVFTHNGISGDVAAPIEQEPSEALDDEFQDADPELNIDDVSLNRPKWSIDAGLQYNWFLSPAQSLVVQAMTDASNLHSGSRLELIWSLRKTFAAEQATEKGWSVNLQLGAQYLDDKAAQYYYGIDERHLETDALRFQAKAAVNPMLALTLSKPLSKDWQLIAFYKHQSLAKRLTSSPKITESQIQTYFVGVIYAF